MKEWNEREMKAVIALAHEYGWNGVENSKFLSVFLRDLLEERTQLAIALDVLRASAIDAVVWYRSERSVGEKQSDRLFDHLLNCTGDSPKRILRDLGRAAVSPDVVKMPGGVMRCGTL